MVKKLSLPKTLTPTWPFFFVFLPLGVCDCQSFYLDAFTHTASVSFCPFASFSVSLSTVLPSCPCHFYQSQTLTRSDMTSRHSSVLPSSPLQSYQLDRENRVGFAAWASHFSSLPPPPLPSTSSLPCTTPSHTDFKGLWVTQRLCTLSQSDSLVSVPGKKCIWEMSNCCM